LPEQQPGVSDVERRRRAELGGVRRPLATLPEDAAAGVMRRLRDAGVEY